MIAGCPSCATHETLPVERGRSGVSMTHCSACGHRWLEAAAIEVVEARFHTPALEYSDDLEDEARRIAEAARAAAARHEKSRRLRRARVRGWGMLGIAVTLPLAGALAFPDAVTSAAPAAARLYGLAGIEVTLPALSLREVASAVSMGSELPQLTVSGEIVNATRDDLEVPPLRFQVRDHTGREVHAWTLDDIGAARLGPGEARHFVTRVAAPPETAREVEIRFARED